jgi:hypothetical protein
MGPPQIDDDIVSSISNNQIKQTSTSLQQMIQIINDIRVAMNHRMITKARAKKINTEVNEYRQPGHHDVANFKTKHERVEHCMKDRDNQRQLREWCATICTEPN